MKKNLSNHGKLIYFLTIVFTLFIVVSCSANASYALSNKEIDYEFESPEINLLVEKILNSPEDCWRKPNYQRKVTIISKLFSLQELIRQWSFEEAYSKMLHDIKPKLTALKTNENEELWGNGVLNQAWVICEDLREEFKVDCNTILEILIDEQPA